MRNSEAGQSRRATVITIAIVLAVIALGTYVTQALMPDNSITMGRGRFSAPK